ncbi:MAG TPA: hypothetical protein VMH83_13450 [Candidatus Acidoferrum sp.]|nr:hypothetical protein [Candidatus Acidoferrum sp.]
MSSSHVRLRKQRVRIPLIAAVAFVIPLSSVLAQSTPTPKAPAGMTVEKDDKNKVTKYTKETSLDVTVKTEFPPSAACTATMDISFYQRNTIAAVEGTIDNPTCGASSGEYELSVSTRNDNGDITAQEFTTPWQRTDAKPLKVKTDYPIGSNVDLSRVRVRHITCTCTAAAPQ